MSISTQGASMATEPLVAQVLSKAVLTVTSIGILAVEHVNNTKLEILVRLAIYQIAIDYFCIVVLRSILVNKSEVHRIKIKIKIEERGCSQFNGNLLSHFRIHACLICSHP